MRFETCSGYLSSSQHQLNRDWEQEWRVLHSSAYLGSHIYLIANANTDGNNVQ